MVDIEKLFATTQWSKRPMTGPEIVQNHLNFTKNASHDTIKLIQCELNIPYGDTQRQKLDIIGTDLSDDAPILVYLHGGYWQAKEITRSSYHYISQILYKNSVKLICMGYDMCPDVTLDQIMQQVQAAVRKCLDYAIKHGSKGLYLMGHSAGGHLVASLFSTLIPTLSKEEQKLIKTVFLTSGVYDLMLFSQSQLNKAVKLDADQASRMSVIDRKIYSGIPTQFFVIVGKNESPEFHKQAKEYSENLKSWDLRVEHLMVENVDHFELVEKLFEEDFQLTRLILNVMLEN